MMANIISQFKVLFYCFNVSGVPAASRRRAFQGSAIAPLFCSGGFENLNHRRKTTLRALPIPDAKRQGRVQNAHMLNKRVLAFFAQQKCEPLRASQNLAACLHAKIPDAKFASQCNLFLTYYKLRITMQSFLDLP